jgi:hypothetical protein
VREADHSPPASAEIKKIWIYISTPPYAFMDNFTFFYLTFELYGATTQKILLFDIRLVQEGSSMELAK